MIHASTQPERPSSRAVPPTAVGPFRRGVDALRLLHRAWRYRRRLNVPELDAMLRLLPRGGVGIDVGAHKGAYSYWMARAVGPGGRVIAIEPQERLAPRTRAALHGLGLRWVDLVHAAASDRRGPVAMDYRRDSTHGAALDGLDGPGVVRTTVEATTIDALAEGLSRVDFIKIDVEGHEQAVLRGALQTLVRHHPALLVEIEARHHARDGAGDGAGGSAGEGSNEGDPLAKAERLLHPLGYQTLAFVGRACRPAAGLQPAALRSASGDRTGVSNNFLFLAARPIPLVMRA